MAAPTSHEGFTLGQASLPMRLMVTLFLLAIVGGILSAHLNLAIRVGTEDGTPGPPTLRDVRYHFAGNPIQSRLAQAISPGGPMSAFVEEEQRGAILDWIQAGAPREGFEREIAPIIENRCMQCHVDADGEQQPFLDSYEHVQALTVPGEAMGVPELALLTHMHALGMATFYALLGLALWLTHASAWLKWLGMVVPMAGVLIDLGGWWLTAQVSGGFAAMVFIGGLMQGVGVIPCLLGPLWEMWLRRG